MNMVISMRVPEMIPVMCDMMSAAALIDPGFVKKLHVYAALQKRRAAKSKKKKVSCTRAHVHTASYNSVGDRP